MIFERIFLKRMSRIWAICKNTKNRLESIVPVKTVQMPTIIPLHTSAFRKSSQHIVFSGLLSWMENSNGLRWFLTHCWNTIHARFPETKLFITGQMADSTLRSFISSFPNVVYKGFVSDLSPIYRASALAIAPLFINAGIKVKVLTYLSYGLPVVSSEEATGGLFEKAGIVTTSKKHFCMTTINLLENVNRRIKLSTEGRRNIQKHHSYKELYSFFVTAGIIKK